MRLKWRLVVERWRSVMPKRKAGYEEMLEDVIETLKHSPDEVNKVFETSGKVVDAANDMTQDELS